MTIGKIRVYKTSIFYDHDNRRKITGVAVGKDWCKLGSYHSPYVRVWCVGPVKVVRTNLDRR